MDWSLKKMLRKGYSHLDQPAPLWRDCLAAVCILLLCILFGLVFYAIDLSEANIITVFILGILMISAITRRPLIWAVSAICGILLFNCLYAEPRFTLNYYDPQYSLTTLIMLAASLLLGGMSEQFRRRLVEKAELSVKAESERLRADLLRAVGHDLRNSLTSISGDAEILLAEGETLGADMRRALYVGILDNAEWLINTSENLLFITRIENDGMELHKQAEPLAEVVEEALRHVSRCRVDQRIELDLCPDLILVSCDARLLAQAVGNIVDNAVKHTPPGSAIRISTRMQGENAIIEVADNGPGLGENRERAFDSFFSTPCAVSAQRPGMGIGLSLCKTIASLHQGRINYRDNQPRGAVFELILPAERIEPV